MISDKDFHVKILPVIYSAISGHDYAAALAEIERVIDKLSLEQKVHCFLLRGEIRNSQGDAEVAREEWITGIQLSRPGSFGRLTLEYELGKSYERSGAKTDALSCYRSAIVSCAEGENFSGSRPLIAFLSLNEGLIEPEDQDIFARAIEKSWEVLGLENEPDLSDLSGAIRALSEGFEDLVRQTKKY